MALSDWLGNVRRLTLGRPRWDAEGEFSYYAVSAEHVAIHRRRQADLVREAHASGIALMRSLGILDTEWLAGKSVLDIGAGECVLSEAIAFAGGARQVWAVDATPKQIWAAAEKYASCEQLKFVIADAQRLPFPDRCFDLVVANLVLHHIHPLDGVLREIHRVLKPGGRFAAAEPNPLVSFAVHIATSPNEAPISPRHVERAIKRAGLTHEETRYWWGRGGTSRLGPLSPGFRVHARRGNSANGADAIPAHVEPVALEDSGLPGLRLDSACSFRQLALQQVAELRPYLS